MAAQKLRWTMVIWKFGNVRGKRQRVQDPQGRVGMSTVIEYFF